MSAVALFETRMVIRGRFNQAGLDRFAEWMEVVPLEIIPFDADQADAAFAAFSRYGKGISPARLIDDDLEHAGSAKSLQRLGVRRLLALLDQLERVADKGAQLTVSTKG